MKNLKIIISEPFGQLDSLRDRLSQVGEIHYGPYNTRIEFKKSVKEADIIMVRLKHMIDQDILNSAPNLKIIISATTGLNHIDLEGCSKRLIKVVSLRGEKEFLKYISSTAELAFGLLLSLIRKISAGNECVVNGGWNRDKYFGYSLSGLTLGILGLGRLGQLTAKYAKAFDMYILGYDPNKQVSCSNVDEVVELEELLTKSDVIMLHASHAPGEPPILGPKEFSLLKTNAYIINTARGELINERSLVTALKDNSLAGYAADVLANEQDVKNNQIFKLANKYNNIILTPHIGGATYNEIQKAEKFVVEKAIKELMARGLF